MLVGLCLGVLRLFMVRHGYCVLRRVMGRLEWLTVLKQSRAESFLSVVRLEARNGLKQNGPEYTYSRPAQSVCILLLMHVQSPRVVTHLVIFHFGHIHLRAWLLVSAEKHTACQLHPVQHTLHRVHTHEYGAELQDTIA